jgi:hypothetical protein
MTTVVSKLIQVIHTELDYAQLARRLTYGLVI